MKLRTKVILGSVAADTLFGPFLVPVETTGTIGGVVGSVPKP